MFVQINDIVQWLYLDRRVNEFIRKQKPSDLQDDLLHHCIAEVYRINDKYPGKIIALFEANQLWPWFHGMVCNQLHSTKSTFYTKFRRENMVYLPVEELPDRPIYQLEGAEEMEAVQKHGANFVNYFYDNFHKRKSLQPKKVAEVVQISMF
ncbi:MAG: hypothetical protein ACI7YS_17400 [Flavobacterium sp.]